MAESVFNRMTPGFDESYHVIVCNHPLYRQLGLTTMTTGTLFDFLYTMDGSIAKNLDEIDSATVDNPEGLYPNRAAFSVLPGDETGQRVGSSEGVQILLSSIIGGGGATPTPLSDYKWMGWRPNEEGTGRYETSSLADWSIFDNDLKSTVDQDNLRIGLKDDGTQGKWTFIGYNDDYVVGFGFDDESEDFDAITSEHKGTHKGRDIFGAEGTFSTAYTFNAATNEYLHPIFDIINMNVYHAGLRNYYPRSTWKTEFPDDNVDVYAEADFLTDVKASKSGCIQWSGLVNFNISYGGGTVSCERAEYVDFSLYLFDKAYQRPKGNGAALRRVNVVAHKRDVANGRIYGKTEDGDHSTVDPNDEATKTAADLDLTYNPVLKKWESGTPNLIGMMKTPLGSAKKVPGIANVLASDIGVDLDGDPDNHFVPSSGIVIPIRPQNGNKHQFMPNYAKNEECRKSIPENDKAKEEFVVYNYNPLKRFDAGTMVMLSRIDGVWMATDMGSGVSIAEEQEVDANVGKWSFNYMMTNYDFLFQDVNGSPYLPRQVEEDFHIKYYSETYGNDEGINHKVQFSGFDTRAATEKNLHSEYYQITSFDQLDSLLYGVRSREAGSETSARAYIPDDWSPGAFHFNYQTPDGDYPAYYTDLPADLNAIATTQASVDDAGRAIPFAVGEFADRNAAHSATFFGCVFPNGYRDEEKLALVANNENITTYEPGCVNGRNSQESTQRRWPFANGGYNTRFKAGNDGLRGIYYPRTDFLRVTDSARTANPFREEIQYPERDDDGNLTKSYSAARSDPRNPVVKEVDEQISLEDNRWQQFNPKQAPSLLHTYNQGVGNRFTFSQMPADVFLNASPSGENGQPQRNIHRCTWMNFMGLDGATRTFDESNDRNQEFRDLVKKTIVDGYWLAFKDPDTIDIDARQYNIMQSWFDITPRSRGTVEYRPLKMEGYCGIHQQSQPSNQKGAYRRFKDQLNSQAGAQMTSNTSPYSRYAINRNITLSYGGYITDGFPGYSFLNDVDITRKSDADQFPTNAVSQGLLINGPDDTQGGKRITANGFGLRCAHDMTKPLFSPNRHNGGYWGPDSETMSLGQKIWSTLQSDPSNDNKPIKLEGIGSGACGVIATSCKVATNENLTFTTTNRYGMNPWTELTGQFTGTGFFLGMFGFDTSSGQDVKTYKSWGTTIPGEPYRQPNTLAMVVRIYHGWPEEQTIFDARNLAVHHFNPDVQYENASNTDGANDGNYVDARHFTIKNFEARDPDAEPDDPNQPIKFSYLAPIPSSTVDMTIPSVFRSFPLWNHDNNAEPTADNALLAEPCPVGATGYRDVVNGDFYGGAGQRELADEELWPVDDKRVGKLLPFRYKTKEFLLQEDDGNPNDPNKDVIELQYDFFPIEADAEEGQDGPRKYPRLKRSSGGIGAVTKWTNLNAAKNDNTPEYTAEEPLDWAPNPQSHGLLITSVGSGYRLGDLFATAYGSLYRVDGIVWSANPEDAGKLYDGSQDPPANEPLGYPWKLKKLNRSRRVNTKDGVATTTPLFSGVNAGIGLFTFGGTGRGWNAAWPVAYLGELEEEDTKPALLEHPTEGDIPKISSELDPPHSDGSDDGAQGWVVGTNTLNYTFNDENRSPDRTYDVFIMMQNDTSFCWQGSIDNAYGNVYNVTECDEQFIRLTIGVD